MPVSSGNWPAFRRSASAFAFSFSFAVGQPADADAGEPVVRRTAPG